MQNTAQLVCQVEELITEFETSGKCATEAFNVAETALERTTISVDQEAITEPALADGARSQNSNETG